MKSAVRQRNRPVAEGAKSERRVSWHENVVDNERYEAPSDDLYLPWYFVLLYLLLLALMAGISLHFSGKLPDQLPDGNQPNQFYAPRARAHMEDLVALGIRNVGSEANEIHAKNLIVRKAEEIRANSSEKVEIEISIQNSTGSFFVDFLGGITHIYQNVTNVAVRLSRRGSLKKDAFMVNAHYDSALGSVAASDDAISCGTMLEVLDCLSSEPHPLLAEHAIIFLFNGAEETMLQASHGFITQHPWASTIRAFLNLEAAGAGGKEIVFQTGPGHPWLAELYSEAVPHPHASVVAQEMFQSGIVISDTDFRIFRDFGHIPGIDTAYFVNGYVYHTEYDVPSAIPDGSVQRAGENVLALLRAVADSSHLSQPTAADIRDKVVFFDILGLMTVVYSEKVAMPINFACLFIVLLTFLRDVNWSGFDHPSKPSPKLLLLSFAVMLVSWVGGVLVTVVVAGVLTLLGQSMSWFSQPLLIIPLYVIPAGLAIGDIHTQLIKRTSYSQPHLEKCSFLSIQFLSSALLFLLTFFRVCSAFVFLIIISFQLMFRNFLYDMLVVPELRKSRVFEIRALAYVLCSAFAAGLPAMLLFQLDVGLVQLFVPLMGRAGAVFPPDVLIAIFIAVSVITITPYMIAALIYSTSRQLKRWVGALLLGVSLVTVVLVGCGFVHPYSVSNPEYPTPKRLFMLHTDRTFHGLDGSVASQDAQIFIYPFDYLGLEPVAKVSPLFREAKKTRCKGLFCSEPNYIPLRNLLESWWLPATPLTGRERPSIQLLSSVKTSDNSKNLTFQTHFPMRCVAVVGMGDGVALKAWSLERYIPPANKCPGSHADKGCYFIFHSRGFGEGNFTIWLEVEGDINVQELLRITITAHHLDPPLSQTAELAALTKDLPDWVTAISWTAIFEEWIF